MANQQASLSKAISAGGVDDRSSGERVRAVLHDTVLQSLGLAMLQADLCRRLWRNGQSDAAAAELDGLVESLEAAVDQIREVMDDLRPSEAPLPRSA